MGSPENRPRQRNVNQRTIASRIRRNHRLKVGGGIATGLLAMATVGVLLAHNRPTDVQPQPLTISSTIVSERELKEEDQLLRNKRIIQEEARRLNIFPSFTEADRWIRFGYPRSEQILSVEENIPEAQRRAISTLSLMTQSENPILPPAANMLLSLADNDKLTITLSSSLRSDFSGKPSIMQTVLAIKDDKLHIFVIVDTNTVLNKTNATILATTFAHEAEHVRSVVTFLATLDDSLTPEEKVRRQAQRTDLEEDYIAEEARGYAKEAEALLYVVGLGFYGTDSTLEELIATYIESGKNPNNPAWKTYISTII